MEGEQQSEPVGHILCCACGSILLRKSCGQGEGWRVGEGCLMAEVWLLLWESHLCPWSLRVSSLHWLKSSVVKITFSSMESRRWRDAYIVDHAAGFLCSITWTASSSELWMFLLYMIVKFRKARSKPDFPYVPSPKYTPSIWMLLLNFDKFKKGDNMKTVC